MAEAYNEETHVIGFPEVEEGVTLLYTRRDCLTLRQRLGVDWFNASSDKLNQFDVEAMEVYLQAGGKKNGKPRPIKLDELENVTLAQVAFRILQALFLSVHGKTFVEYTAWVMGELQKRPPMDPQNDPASFLPNLTPLLSGSDSPQENLTTSPPPEPNASSKSVSGE